MIDPVDFVEQKLVDPETGECFGLYEMQRRFLRLALTLTAEGRLEFPEMVFGAIKKSGKTELAAFCALYVALVIGGPFAEVYCVANDLEQAQGRVFRACVRLVEANPVLRRSAKITTSKIEFENGSVIVAIASDFAGAAGGNPSLVVFDELWAATSERAHRLWDEMVPVPTRKVSGRLTVTYAGFVGESDLLEKLYRRGLEGEEIGPALRRQPGMLALWATEPLAPWQTPAWVEQMRQQLRPSAFLRMICNQWVTSESGFVEIGWWDQCVDQGVRPVTEDRNLRVFVGVDASVKRDSTALVAVTWEHDTKRVRLVRHRVFQPSPADPLDFEATIERELGAWDEFYNICAVYFDPYQLVATAQRLQRAGLPMREFPQTVPNLTEASTNLYDLIRGRNLVLYPDSEMRLAVSRCVAIETSRGWRIAKEKQSHKIDSIVALAQAALAAVTHRVSGGGPATVVGGI